LKNLTDRGAVSEKEMLIFTKAVGARRETKDKGAVCRGVRCLEAHIYSLRFVACGTLRIHDLKSFSGWSGLCGVSRKQFMFRFLFHSSQIRKRLGECVGVFHITFERSPSKYSFPSRVA